MTHRSSGDASDEGHSPSSPGHHHRKASAVSVSVAVITVSDTRTHETDTGGALVADLLAGAGSRARAFLATKVWIEGRQRGIDQMRASQRLFRSEVIDLMQVHNLVDWRTQLSTIKAWKERGIVRYTGITHYTPGAFDRLVSVIEAERPDFVQLPYSITVREAEARLLPLAAEKGVAVIVNRPYEGGGLFRRPSLSLHAVP